MVYDEELLSEKLVGNLFLIPPLDVRCEYCNHLQKVPIPVRVVEVKDGLIKGEAGSMVYRCDGCGAPAGVSWDGADVQVTEFTGE